jgi:hypothetical protein
MIAVKFKVTVHFRTDASLQIPYLMLCRRIRKPCDTCYKTQDTLISPLEESAY